MTRGVAAMSRKPLKPSKTDSSLSDRDKKSEQMIAALKYLTEECRTSDLTEFAGIIEEAFDRCVRAYVAGQRETLAGRAGKDIGDPEQTLN